MQRLVPALAAVWALLSGPAGAGEQYVDGSGFANAGYDVVAYFDLEQAPLGRAQPPAVPGSAAYTAEYNGATFAFASPENLARFRADPARYAPQFDGHCAFGVAQRAKVPANPHLWRIVDGKLYLNITPRIAKSWERHVESNLQRAGRYWPELEPKPASSDAIPEFDVSDAPRS